MFYAEYGVNTTHNLLEDHTKEFIQVYWRLWLNIAEGAFQVVICNFFLMSLV